MSERSCDKFTTNLYDPRTKFNNKDYCMRCGYQLSEHEMRYV